MIGACCRLPGEVLVCWRRHSSGVQQLHTCPVPLPVLRPQQGGHTGTGGKVPQRRPCWRSQGQCWLPGERHSLGILREHSWTFLLCEGLCVWVSVLVCIVWNEVGKLDIMAAKHHGCCFYLWHYWCSNLQYSQYLNLLLLNPGCNSSPSNFKAQHALDKGCPCSTFLL